MTGKVSKLLVMPTKQKTFTDEMLAGVKVDT